MNYNLTSSLPNSNNQNPAIVGSLTVIDNKIRIFNKKIEDHWTNKIPLSAHELNATENSLKKLCMQKESEEISVIMELEGIKLGGYFAMLDPTSRPFFS